MEREWKGIIIFIVCICMITGCYAKEQNDDIGEERKSSSELYEESQDEQNAPVDSQETYGVSDIRTRAPKIGESKYSEQDVVAKSEEACNLSQEILTHPRKVFVLGSGYANPLEVLLDVDLDGIPDNVSLSIQGESELTYLYKEINGIPYVKWEQYTLAVNENTTDIGFIGAKETGSCRWNILAFSPDGEKILLALTEAISEEQLQGNWTYVFAYQNGGFTEVLAEQIDLLGEHTVIGKDNLVAWRIPFSPLESRVLFEWKVDENGIYQRHYEDMYDYLDECTVMVAKPIVLRKKPNEKSRKVATVNQKKVVVKKSEMILERDYKPLSTMYGTGMNWMYLETMDGTGGWIQVGGYVQLADGEWVQVFEAFNPGNSEY